MIVEEAGGSQLAGFDDVQAFHHHRGKRAVKNTYPSPIVSVPSTCDIGSPGCKSDLQEEKLEFGYLGRQIHMKAYEAMPSMSDIIATSTNSAGQQLLECFEEGMLKGAKVDSSTL